MFLRDMQDMIFRTKASGYTAEDEGRAQKKA